MSIWQFPKPFIFSKYGFVKDVTPDLKKTKITYKCSNCLVDKFSN